MKIKKEFKKVIIKKLMDIRLYEKENKKREDGYKKDIIEKFLLVLKPRLLKTNIFGFIILMVISEKQMGNKFKFLMDKKLLRGKTNMKYAIFIELGRKNDNNSLMMIQYIYKRLVKNKLEYLSLDYFLLNDKINYINSKEVEKKNKIMRQMFKKALFMYLYNYDLDFYNYYDVVNKLKYDIEYCILFKLEKNKVFNGLLSAYNYNFISNNKKYEYDIGIVFIIVLKKISKKDKKNVDDKLILCLSKEEEEKSIKCIEKFEELEDFGEFEDDVVKKILGELCER